MFRTIIFTSCFFTVCFSSIVEAESGRRAVDLKAPEAPGDRHSADNKERSIKFKNFITGRFSHIVDKDGNCKEANFIIQFCSEKRDAVVDKIRGRQVYRKLFANTLFHIFVEQRSLQGDEIIFKKTSKYTDYEGCLSLFIPIKYAEWEKPVFYFSMNVYFLSEISGIYEQVIASVNPWDRSFRVIEDPLVELLDGTVVRIKKSFNNSNSEQIAVSLGLDHIADAKPEGDCL